MSFHSMIVLRIEDIVCEFKRKNTFSSHSLCKKVSENLLTAKGILSMKKISPKIDVCVHRIGFSLHHFNSAKCHIFS